MVSLLRGLPAIIAEIEQRILACVPTAFSTDTWVKADRKQYEAQNDLLIDYWRHFDLDIPDSDPSPFAGNYAYQNREIRLDIYSWYSRAGANRVAGNPDVDWQALMLQDAHDLQRALQGPIVTADGSTGRLLYDNANRSEDDEEATLVVSFRLPVFLRGTAQVPALYLGPSQQHALDGGSKFYLVAQSDLACSGVLASSPAGCTHETALDLGSGTPQVIEVTCTTAGTYTFTLTGAGGTSTCTITLYPSSDFVILGPDQAVPNDQWTLNLAVAAASNGVLPVIGSANLALPETVEIVNNKGVIPVTIVSRGSHSVAVGGDTCNFTSVAPSAKVPLFCNDRTAQLAASVSERVCAYGAVGQTGNVTVGRSAIDGHKRFTIAFRFKYVSGSGGSWNTLFGVHTNWYIQHNNSGQRILYLAYGNYQNTATKGYVLSNSFTVGVLANVVIVYDFDVVARTGSILCYLNSTTPTVLPLVDIDEVGRYDAILTDAVWSMVAMDKYYCKAALYDIIIHNTIAWPIETVTQFLNAEAIDQSNYTAYWPLQKNTDLPYLVDYDLKNNVPLYIPGPHPNLEWVAKP